MGKNYKKRCIIIGIILLVMIIGLVFTYGVKIIKEDLEKQRADKELTSYIEQNLNLTDEEKAQLDYDKLIKDIKAASNRNWNHKYGGNGYEVEEPEVIDAHIYDFYKNDKKIYTVVLNQEISGGMDINSNGVVNFFYCAYIGIIFVLVLLGITYFIKYKRKKL